jgi:hypothetical protein
MSTKSHASDFRKILDRISHRHDTRSVFDGFVRLAACALAAQTREAEYLDEAKRWERCQRSVKTSHEGSIQNQPL